MSAKWIIADRFISRGQLFADWLSYFLSARHGRGHGIHSPFVFDFITSVLNDPYHYPAFDIAEKYRNSLRKNSTPVTVIDMGAGSKAGAGRHRIISDIAADAAVNRKFGRLLYRLARHYKPELIIEFGTSLGVSTHYLAAGNPGARVITVEADPVLAAFAAKGLKDNRFNHVQVIPETFDHVLQGLLPDRPGRTLVFIDGNHNYAATLKYADYFLSRIPDGSLIVLDDIRWSAGMRQSWREIQGHDKSRLTVDLFFLGIVFLQQDFFKENYTIRF